MTFLRIALFVVLLVAVFFFRQWLPWANSNGDGSQVVTEQPVGQPVGQPVVGSTSAPASSVPANPPASSLRIDGHLITSIDKIRNFQVVDGDSIRWNNATGTVDYRLASIDAPELSQPFGQRAKKYLQTILAGKELTAYQNDVDRYGRRVAYLFATSPSRPGVAEDINARMVADGYAWHAIRHSQNPNLTRLEATARSSAMGLWEQRTPVAPWDYRDAGSRAQSSVAVRP